MKKGWTQKVLSEISGVAVANISKVEGGRSNIGEEWVILLAEAFVVKPEFILFPNGLERRELRKILRTHAQMFLSTVGCRNCTVNK